MRLPRNIYIKITALLLCAGCATSPPAKESDRNFYREYSKKMGVDFKGNEDKALIKASEQWMGVPYRYGGTTRKGVDCSALIGHIYKEAHAITLPRSASGIAKHVKRIKKNELACGDLVFFTIKEKRVSHVGMYLNDSKFVHASSSKGVSVANLNDSYWSKYFSGAGRVKELNQKPEKVSLQQDVKKQVSPSRRTPPPPRTKPAKSSKPKKTDTPKVKEPEVKIIDTIESNDVIIVFDEEF